MILLAKIYYSNFIFKVRNVCIDTSESGVLKAITGTPSIGSLMPA